MKYSWTGTGFTHGILTFTMVTLLYNVKYQQKVLCFRIIMTVLEEPWNTKVTYSICTILTTYHAGSFKYTMVLKFMHGKQMPFLWLRMLNDCLIYLSVIVYINIPWYYHSTRAKNIVVPKYYHI